MQCKSGAQECDAFRDCFFGFSKTSVPQDLQLLFCMLSFVMWQVRNKLDFRRRWFYVSEINYNCEEKSGCHV